MSNNPLDTLFNPKAIAIVGASDRASSWTREIYSNLLSFGFPGQIFPINPGRSTVWEQRAYPSLGDAPDIDLAVVAIPAPAAVEAVAECGAAGVPAAMVVSSGFRDAGPAGARLQEQLAAAAEDGGVALLGPNLEGFINYHGRVAAYGAEMPEAPAAGSISMFSQSGTAAWTFAHMAGDRHVGARLVTGVGVEATLGVGELLAWAAADPQTRVVACYIEAVRDFGVLARGFEALAEAGKRCVVCCPRISGEAARASAVAHTGELLGDTTLRDAAFRRLGAAVVHDPIALFETAVLLANAPPRTAGKVAVAMQSGGNCTMFTDALTEAEVAVEPLRRETLGKLEDILPTFSEPRNPLDVTGQAVFDTEVYCGAIDVLADDPEVGMIVIDVAPSRKDPDGSVCTEILRHAAEVQRSSRKPVLSVLATPFSYPGRTVEPLADASLAILHGHAAAAVAIAELSRCSQPRRDVAERTVDPAGVSLAPGVLDEVAAAELLSAYGIERPREALARTPEQAAELAAGLNGRAAGLDGTSRVVVKLVCAEVPHKSRVGLVKLDLATPEEVESAAREIQHRARQLGVDGSRLLVQEQLEAGPEYLLGVSVDPVYGPAMTVRPGGGDVAGESVFYPLPLRQGEAAQMAAAAAASPGLSESDLARLADAVDRLSWLAVDLSARLLEIEANPILVSGGRAVAVDALAVAKDKPQN